MTPQIWCEKNPSKGGKKLTMDSSISVKMGI